MDRGDVDNPNSAIPTRGDEHLPPMQAGWARHWHWLVAGGIVLCNFLAGLLWRLAYTNAYFESILVLNGILFTAQAGVVTLWLVWGPQSFGWRLLIHWIIVLGFSLATLVGFAVALPGTITVIELLQKYGRAVALLPALSLGLQLPLWPLRVYGGWRVERITESPPTSAPEKGREPLAIRDLLLGTFVAALGLGGIRTAMAGILSVRSPVVGSEEWIAVSLIGLLMLMLVALLGYLPALFLLLRTKSTRRAIALWYSYNGLLWLALFLIQSLSGPSDMAVEMLFSTLMFFGAFATALGLPLLLARRDGWRLCLAGDKPDAAS
jgi:hypothetical protein